MLFYHKEGERVTGPLDEAGFLEELRADGLHAGTLVKTDGMKEWITLEELLATGVFEHESVETWEEQRKRDQKLLEWAMTKQRLEALPAEFGKGPEKVRAYAEFLARNFSPERPPGACAVDPKAPAEERALVYWEGQVLKRAASAVEQLFRTVGHLLGPVGVILVSLQGQQKMEKLAFITAHDFSRAEAEAVRRRLKRGDRLAAGAGAAVLLSVVGFFFAMVCSLDYSSSGRGTFFYVWLVGAIALLLGALFLIDRADRLRSNWVLATLKKAPFKLKKLEWVNLQPDESQASGAQPARKSRAKFQLRTRNGSGK